MHCQILVSTIHAKSQNDQTKISKFKILAQKWNDEFELRHGSNSLSHIQNYFAYIFKKHETFTDNLLLWIYFNKIEKRNTFIFKTEKYCNAFNAWDYEITWKQIKEYINKFKNGEKCT